ncbi:MAG: C39 family peptidase [Nitrospirae bacterium]|nr:C39 family peptidase [Nitrospirota bacterium]
MRGLIVGIFMPVIGCSPLFSSPEPQSDFMAPSIHRVSGVPFYPQEDFQCGPASLASLLNFGGENAEPGEIARQIDVERLGGSLPLDLELYARRFESSGSRRVRVTRDDPDVLKRQIDAGRPVILFLDLGFWAWRKGHFIVAVGYDDVKRQAFAHSGREPASEIPYDTLFRQWARTGYWSLSLVPETKDGD